MTVNDERVIALSRSKLILTIAGAVVMAGAGVWFLVASDDGSLVTELRRFVPPWFIHDLGLVAALFFGGVAVYAIRKSFDTRPGLTLSSEGLVDNSSAAAAGFIPWSEVVGVGTCQVHRQRMLVVHVADPGRYIERGNAMKRALNRANANMCGSPIVISSHALQIPFDVLRKEVAAYLSRYAANVGGEGARGAHPPG